jgi:hypothetical protein
MTDVILYFYDGAYTSITTAEGTGEIIDFMKGVKQDCPLDLTLFNICK